MTQATVLVVDDTPSKRYVLASWLRRRGYPVVEASTGGEALDVVGRGGIDLVVLDVRLPDMTGFEVCEQIKSDPVNGAIPVIHVSAAAVHAVDRTQGLERGADAYLVEPIDPDELLATILSVQRYFQARRHAEQLANRLADLARFSVAMSGAPTERDLLDNAVRGAASIFSAPAVVVMTRIDGTRVAGMCAGPDQPVRIRRLSATAGPGRDAAARPADTGEAPVGVSFHDQPAAGLPPAGWDEQATIRVLSARLRADQPPVAVMVPTSVTKDGDPVLTLLGQTVMSAVNVQRLYEQEHDLALTLQRSLLPRRLPEVAGLEFAVRYVPASDRAEIGGDFYEVARFGDEVMVAVGDVGGHSLVAATIMAELRHATRAYLAEGHGPAAVLDRLNHLMAQLIPGAIATLCLVAIDIATGRVRVANAGHPPPLLYVGGRAERIDIHSPLLGLRAGVAREGGFDLPPGGTLLLYTDGLVENRADSLDVGIDRLAGAMAWLNGDIERFASRILEEVGPADVEDDIAMVVVRRSALS